MVTGGNSGNPAILRKNPLDPLAGKNLPFVTKSGSSQIGGSLIVRIISRKSKNEAVNYSTYRRTKKV